MTIWRRIARLIDQSRIRLPPRPIRADELRTGDWVQIGSERFRVIARRFELDQVVFRLRPRNGTGGTGGVLLLAPRGRAGTWTLDDGRVQAPLPPELLVVFPVV